MVLNVISLGLEDQGPVVDALHTSIGMPRREGGNFGGGEEKGLSKAKP